MARAATTSDVFNAVAEPRRRAILDLLLQSEQPVQDLVMALDMEQPAVSKHLRVLREVGLVVSRQDGRHRLYRADGTGLKPLHDWVQQYERYWENQLERIKASAEAKAKGTQA